MPYVFNPFTGNFDVVDTNTAAGSDTEVQFNDNGSLNGDTGLTFNKTTNALTVGASTVDGGSAKIYGDIDLDDGGSFSTTVQAVTPTANRTISFPDATGTVALVNGANGTIQYNDAGTLKGNSDFTVDPDWNDASTVFTGLKLNVTDTASAAGSNLLDLQSGGTSKAKIDASGDYYGALYSFFGETNRVSIRYGGTRLLTIDQTGTRPGARVGSNSAFAWSSLANSEGNPDLSLYRDASDTLAQRRGTNAQTFRLYNTYTDASNFERTSLTRDSSGLVIDAQKGGTGADPTNLLDVKLDGTSRFSVLSTGKLSLKADTAASTNTAEITLTSGNGNFGSISSGGGGEIYVQGTYNRSIFGTRLGSGNSYAWSPASSASQAADTALARDSAGVVKVTDGSTGDGTISAQLRAVGTAPATASATGTAGDIRYDADYIYVCTATDTWKRAALATW